MNIQERESNLDTRTKLVESARQLFWAQGYEATSVAEILEGAGVNSGSLYYFFEGKEDLLIAVLERYEELLDPMVIAPVRRESDGSIEDVFSVLEGYRQGLLTTRFTHGCPIGSLALEVTETHPASREGIRRNFAAWRGAIEGFLSEAEDGLPEDADHVRIATFVLAVMEGAVMQARIERDIAPFDACVDELRKYFRGMLEQKASFETVKGPDEDTRGSG